MRPEVNKVRLVVLIALLFSALCAAVFRTTPILFMAALLCGAPLIGFLFARLGSRGLKVVQTLPETGTAGELLTGKITLFNKTRFPNFLIHMRSGMGTLHGENLKKHVLKENTSSAVITPLLPEWIVPFLGAGKQVDYQQQWQLKRRGIYTLAPTRAGTSDPLGLVLAMPIHSSANTIVVLPRPLKIEQLGFLSGEGTASQTPHHSAMVANAMDFHGVRPWIAGETIRRAHWKSTARTGQLHIIEWEETPTADLAIFIDTHAGNLIGEEEENSLEWSITAAATVISHLLENGCRVQLFYFTSQADARSKNSPVSLQLIQEQNVHGRAKMLRALAEIEAVHDPESDLHALAEAALPKVARGLGVLLLTSAHAPFSQVQRQIQAGIPQAFCYALAFDAEPEEEPGRLLSPTSPRTWHYTAPRIGRGMCQIVHGQKTLAAVLESNL